VHQSLWATYVSMGQLTLAVIQMVVIVAGTVYAWSGRLHQPPSSLSASAPKTRR